MTAKEQEIQGVVFGQAEADCIFEELKVLQIELDDDPLAHGPKRLNQKVSDVRRMLARCERLFLDVSQKLHRCKRLLKAETLRLDLGKKNLLANDPHTRAGRSIADREAIMSGKLGLEIQTVHELEMTEQDLTSVLLVIRAKRTDLRDAEGRLRDQIRICQEEIGLGARWGSKIPKGSDMVLPDVATPADLGALNDLLAGVEGEIHVAAAKGAWTAVSDDEDVVVEASNIVIETPEVISDFDLGFGKEGVDLNKALPLTSDSEALDSFLTLDITTPLPVQKKKKEVTPLDDNLLDDILGSFEKP